jgi:hypothetical protein
MTESFTKSIYDCSTNSITTTPMTDEEISELLARREAEAAAVIAAETKATTDAIARAALLERLGITEEEAVLLLGGN